MIKGHVLITVNVLIVYLLKTALSALPWNLSSFLASLLLQNCQTRWRYVIRLRLDCSQPLFFREIVEIDRCSLTGRNLGSWTRAKTIHGLYALSPVFARIHELRWRPVGLKDRFIRHHGILGGCVQSKLRPMVGLVFSDVRLVCMVLPRLPTSLSLRLKSSLGSKKYISTVSYLSSCKTI